MRRYEIFVAVIFSDHRFKVIEVLASGVGFITQHHSGPLPVAHRASAGVRQQVNVNVPAAGQERVVPGFLDS